MKIRHWHILNLCFLHKLFFEVGKKKTMKLKEIINTFHLNLNFQFFFFENR